MRGNFGYSNKLPTYAESFYIGSDGGYSTRSLLYITKYFYFRFTLLKRYNFFLFNMKKIDNYKGSMRCTMEKFAQEFPFNEEQSIQGSTNLFLSLNNIRQVNLQFSFISSNIYDSFNVGYLCSLTNFESSFSKITNKNTIDLFKENNNNEYNFCVSLPKCYLNYMLFKPQNIDEDNNITIKTIDICPHAIHLNGNTSFVEEGKIYFYLNISNYKIGDNIYLQFIFNNYNSTKINNFLLYYNYSNDNDIDNFKNLNQSNITTYTYNDIDRLYIFYDSLEVKQNLNYFLFFVEFYSSLTVKLTETNEF